MQSITHIAASAIRVTSPHARRIAAYPHALAGITSLSSRAPRTSLCRHRSVVQQITRIVCTSRVVCAGSPNVKEEVHRQSDHTSLYIRLSRFNFRLDLISMRYSGESRLHWRRWHQFRITRGTLGPLSSFTASAGCLFLSYSGPEPEAGPATHRYVTEWWVCCTFNIPSALRPAAQESYLCLFVLQGSMVTSGKTPKSSQTIKPCWTTSTQNRPLLSLACHPSTMERLMTQMPTLK